MYHKINIQPIIAINLEENEKLSGLFIPLLENKVHSQRLQTLYPMLRRDRTGEERNSSAPR